MVTADTPFEQKKLGRKHIKSFASGIAHMFACSAQHYAWLAYQHQLSTVAIDLLEMRIEPAEFDIERNRILAGMCQRTLSETPGNWHHPVLWLRRFSLPISGLMTIRRTAVLHRLAGPFSP
jgi:hypothetical protein